MFDAACAIVIPLGTLPATPHVAPAVDEGEITALATLLGSPRLARKALARFGCLRELARASDHDLQHAGLNQQRIDQVRAAVSVGLFAHAAPILGAHLQRASDVAHRYSARLCLSPVEEFWAIALNVRNHVTHEFMISRGTLTGVDVHPRDVFHRLIHAGAASVIFCHNHPSGDPSPSRQDIELTSRLREVGTLVGITVLDHVIVAGDQFVSLAERGWQ